MSSVIFASASWALRFCASFTEVAYSPCETIVLMVDAVFLARLLEVVGGLVEVTLGHGRASGSDL